MLTGHSRPDHLLPSTIVATKLTRWTISFALCNFIGIFEVETSILLFWGFCAQLCTYKSERSGLISQMRSGGCLAEICFLAYLTSPFTQTELNKGEAVRSPPSQDAYNVVQLGFIVTHTALSNKMFQGLSFYLSSYVESKSLWYWMPMIIQVRFCKFWNTESEVLGMPSCCHKFRLLFNPLHSWRWTHMDRATFKCL